MKTKKSILFVNSMLLVVLVTFLEGCSKVKGLLEGSTTGTLPRTLLNSPTKRISLAIRYLPTKEQDEDFLKIKRAVEGMLKTDLVSYGFRPADENSDFILEGTCEYKISYRSVPYKREFPFSYGETVSLLAYELELSVKNLQIRRVSDNKVLWKSAERFKTAGRSEMPKSVVASREPLVGGLKVHSKWNTSIDTALRNAFQGRRIITFH